MQLWFEIVDRYFPPSGHCACIQSTYCCPPHHPNPSPSHPASHIPPHPPPGQTRPDGVTRRVAAQVQGSACVCGILAPLSPARMLPHYNSSQSQSPEPRAQPAWARTLLFVHNRIFIRACDALLNPTKGPFPRHACRLPLSTLGSDTSSPISLAFSARALSTSASTSSQAQLRGHPSAAVSYTNTRRQPTLTRHSRRQPPNLISHTTGQPTIQRNDVGPALLDMPPR